MSHRPVAFAFAAALAVLPSHPPAPAAAPSNGEAVALSAQTQKPPPKRRAARRAQETGQIACTFLGCRRVPRHCHPEPGFNPWTGEPTGYDVVVCR